jgi:uncharacterized membrane protein YfcA
MHPTDTLYTLSGFCVGALVGMTGVGGGSLMTPLLILLFGIHPSAAIGTDLLYASITKAGGAAIHGLNRTVDWLIVRRLASGSVPASAVTLAILSYYDLATAPMQRFLSVGLGAALVITALTVIFRPQIVAWFTRRVGEPPARVVAMLTVATGAILGVLVSLTSVGAGALGVTALVLVYPRLPTSRIIGSDIAHAVPLTLVAGIGHLSLSPIDFSVLGLLLLGSLPGIFVGSQLAVLVSDAILRLALSSVLVIVGSRLLL